jgi:hypothetical protein
MKKLIGPFAKVFGAIFTVGVFVIIISLSYAAIGRIFPNSLFDQVTGMLLFDAAAVVWFLTFIGNCKSVSQYVFSGLGFGLGVLGSIGLIGIEVGISSGMLTAADMVKPLTYVFISAAVGHLLLTYMFHGSAPEISSEISMGVELAKLEDEGMRQAELQVQQNMQLLGNVISNRIYARLMTQMNLPSNILEANMLPMDNTLHVPSNGYPLPTQESQPSFFSDPRGWFNRKLGRQTDNGSQIKEQAVTQVVPSPTPNYYPPYGERQHPDVVFARLPSDELARIRQAWLDYDNQRTQAVQESNPSDAGAPDNYGPAWNKSTDVSPTLDAYAWSCLNCDGSNPPHTQNCQWCKQPRTNGSPVTAFSDLPPAHSEPHTVDWHVEQIEKEEGGSRSPFQPE